MTRIYFCFTTDYAFVIYICWIFWVFFLQDDQEGHEIHQGDAPEEKEQVPHLDLLQQVLSQSDLDMDMDQPTSDVDMDEGASVIEQSPKQAASQEPHVILSPEQFRIRDAEDEEEHNEVIQSCI